MPQLTKPLYDISKSYHENAEKGPTLPPILPKVREIPNERWTSFLELPLASPIGVPAGPLLNSRWIEAASALGFDLLTYKTIRSAGHPGHPLPNVVFVTPEGMKQGTVKPCKEPQNSEQISITNSFGMPSMPKEFLEIDIAKAKASLKRGQILIVSVVGSQMEGHDFTEDFVLAAKLAKAAGADVVEANFSCPNVTSKESSLYRDPQSAYEVAKKLAKALFPLPLMIKIGSIPEQELLKELLISLAKAGVRAVCGINSVPMQLFPPLAKGRETSGICGSMIFPQALEFTRNASALIRACKLDLELAGCGGIMVEEQFDAILKAGAHAALTATGMMWDPYLAIKWKERHG